MSAVNVQNVTINNHAEFAANSDWALIKLVTLANNSDFEIGIRLNMGGILLSGTLVGGGKYFKSTQHQVASFGGATATVRDALAEIAEEGRRIYETPTDRPPEYIHLADVHFLNAGGGAEPEKASLWRGKIADITGFALRLPND